jgi:hypothetical protein
MSNSALSPNFVFLTRHEPQLVRLGTLAERYFKDDPCTCLIKLRQFGELLAQLTAANAGLYRDERESQLELCGGGCAIAALFAAKSTKFSTKFGWWVTAPPTTWSAPTAPPSIP